MSGIYIHIPFCKQACHYCDFHFSTSLQNKPAFLGALKKEIGLRSAYLGTDQVQTIYLGGGTPSLLSGEELNLIFKELHTHFNIAADAEITLEANPDDLSLAKLDELKRSQVNRLSIGIQSFREEDLQMMNRAHSAAEAADCVKKAQDKGFSNISIDLIYGIPGLTEEDWRKNLQAAAALQVTHLSSYCLTIEPRTAMASFIKKGKMAPVNDELSASHFRILKEEMRWNEFVHYEISNFGKEGFFSKHNSNYWKGTHYLGLGPSAHSFNGYSRQWNVSNNNVYIRGLETGQLTSESETLTSQQQYNEYVMTSLRTIWGCDLNLINQRFGLKMMNHCNEEAEFYIHSGGLIQKGSVLLLSDEGMLIADRIAADLFCL
jgi:oxygen-independent coproporphyrinogen-3 oxidase